MGEETLLSVFFYISLSEVVVLGAVAAFLPP